MNYLPENKKVRIYGDFNNADEFGRIRLSTTGSQEDIARLGCKLKEGMFIEVYDDDLSADGVARFSESEKIWVVEVNWNEIRHKNST